MQVIHLGQNELAKRWRMSQLDTAKTLIFPNENARFNAVTFAGIRTLLNLIFGQCKDGLGSPLELFYSFPKQIG
jgi:hypothetical protein